MPATISDREGGVSIRVDYEKTPDFLGYEFRFGFDQSISDWDSLQPAHDGLITATPVQFPTPENTAMRWAVRVVNLAGGASSPYFLNFTTRSGTGGVIYTADLREEGWPNRGLINFRIQPEGTLTGGSQQTWTNAGDWDELESWVGQAADRMVYGANGIVIPATHHASGFEISIDVTSVFDAGSFALLHDYALVMGNGTVPAVGAANDATGWTRFTRTVDIQPSQLTGTETITLYIRFIINRIDPDATGAVEVSDTLILLTEL